MGTTEQMRSELENNGVFFSYPKPINLIEYLIRIGSVNDDDIIMDFFSGSATTAHAVMKINAQDGSHKNTYSFNFQRKLIALLRHINMDIEIFAR